MVSAIQEPDDWHDYVLFMQHRAQITHVGARLSVQADREGMGPCAEICRNVELRLAAAWLLFTMDLGAPINDARFAPEAA